MQKLYEVNKE